MKQKTHSDILIKNAIVITIDKDRTVFLNGAVAVKGSKIIDIGPVSYTHLTLPTTPYV